MRVDQETFVSMRADEIWQFIDELTETVRSTLAHGEGGYARSVGVALPCIFLLMATSLAMTCFQTKGNCCLIAMT